MTNSGSLGHACILLLPGEDSGAGYEFDAVYTADVLRNAAGEPLSFLHVSRAEIDLPPDTNPYADAVYRRAAENLAAVLGDKQGEQKMTNIVDNIEELTANANRIARLLVDAALELWPSEGGSRRRGWIGWVG